MQSKFEYKGFKKCHASEPKPYPEATKSELLGASPNLVGFGNLVVLMRGKGVETTTSLVLNLTLLVSNRPEGLINKDAETHSRFSDF